MLLLENKRHKFRGGCCFWKIKDTSLGVAEIVIRGGRNGRGTKSEKFAFWLNVNNFRIKILSYKDNMLR